MKEQEDQQPEEVDQRGEQRLAVGYPAAQGLYDPQFERDACGMGFVVDMHGRASQDIVQKALAVVDHLTHRGAKGAEATTGDGAGMMVQIPHQFLQKVCQQEGFTLPEPGHYGVGMVFLSPN
ncbi:MAG TPA: hypothetical protein PLK31_15950, partial [Chloroflexota bacterium]|nr:hypothetical protein [Chloroflexota bacterium]